MKKILIYKGEGADAFCVASLLFALKQEKFDQTHYLTLVDQTLFQTKNWQKDVALIIFPGGRDIPYHHALKGNGNLRIRDYVERGGRFLGICAGGYYGSSIIEFEQGGPLEVLAERELKFFPGIARGPAYGPGRFCYCSEKGAQVAQLSLEHTSIPTSTAAYYNGGCLFVGAEKYENVSVIARYTDIEQQPAAVVKCQIGAGSAILSGVHPEYCADYESAKSHLSESLFSKLKEIENKRRTLFSTILTLLV